MPCHTSRPKSSCPFSVPSRSTDCEVPFSIFSTRNVAEKSRNITVENWFVRQHKTAKREQRKVILRPTETVARQSQHSNSHRTPKRRNRFWAGLSAVEPSEALRRHVTVVLCPHTTVISGQTWDTASDTEGMSEMNRQRLVMSVSSSVNPRNGKV